MSLPQLLKLKQVVSSMLVKKKMYPSSLLYKKWVTHSHSTVLPWRLTILPHKTFLLQKIHMKYSKAFDMLRYHWIKDQIAQNQFNCYWAEGQLNRADYFTKHHHLLPITSLCDVNIFNAPKLIPVCWSCHTCKGVFHPSAYIGYSHECLWPSDDISRSLLNSTDVWSFSEEFIQQSSFISM